MKFTRTHLLLAAAMLTAESAVTAATINVPADQATVQAAITAAAATGDTIVVAAGTYTGTIDINNKSLTLKGASSSSRPIFVFTGQNTIGASTAAAGMTVHGDGSNITIQDMIFLPGSAMATTAKGVLVGNNTAAATVTVHFTNLLFAPNNGSNAVATSDPFDNTTLATGKWPNDVFYMINANGFGGMANGTGVYTMNDVTIIGGGRDSIVCYPGAAGSGLTVNGCVVNRSSRNALQWGDDGTNTCTFTITGTRAKPGLLLRRNNEVTPSSGITVTGINSSGTVAIDHLVVLEAAALAANSPEGFNLGVGDAVGTVTVTDSLFAGNPGIGLDLTETGATPTVTLANNTFFGNGTGLGLNAAGVTVTARDNVFAGAGVGANIATGNGVGATFNKNAFVTAGTNALTTQTSGDAPASNTGVVNADPSFPSVAITSLTALQTSFDVANSAYFTASSTSGPLNGWGDGPASGPTSASRWTMYN